MSLVYVEFETNSPPSMSDEEIKALIKKYKDEKYSNNNQNEITERHSTRDILESIDKKYEQQTSI